MKMQEEKILSLSGHCSNVTQLISPGTLGQQPVVGVIGDQSSDITIQVKRFIIIS